MRPMLLVAIAVGLLVSPAVGWDEPDSFRGIRWGTTQERVLTALREQDPPEYRGTYRASSCQPTFCISHITIGPVSAGAILRFRDDKFVGVDIGFSASSYADLRSIFVERYGAPSSRREEEFKTKGGVTTQNEVLTWSGGKVEISLRTYGNFLSEGKAAIMLRSEVEQRERERKAGIKKGKDDL